MTHSETQYQSCGKQVLLGTTSICDAASNEVADRIVAALNAHDYLDIDTVRERVTDPFPIGYEEDAPCNRPNPDALCHGKMIFKSVDCYCHISPPCEQCLDGLTCTECGWRASDDQ